MMTRAEEDAILVPIALASNSVDCDLQPSWMSYPTVNEAYRDIRAALRLDDKRLEHAIAWGAHRQPWHSKPDRDRYSNEPSTNHSVVRC